MACIYTFNMVIWDNIKNIKLKVERNISFEEISDIILRNKYIEIIDHPKRKNQSVFVIEFCDYIYAVPFIVDKNKNIILKTAFPSRKLHKKYRGER